MHGKNLWGILGGAVLIGLGVIFLLGQLLRIEIWSYIWPLIIVGAGLIFFAGMVAGGRSTGPLAIPGAVLVNIGLLLFGQNLFGMWSTWTYAWALIIVSVGVGLYIFGRWSQVPEMRAVSRVVVVVGLALFFLFGLFFEFGAAMLGMRSPGGIIWPVALILLGLYVLLARPLLRLGSSPVERGPVVVEGQASAPEQPADSPAAVAGQAVPVYSSPAPAGWSAGHPTATGGVIPTAEDLAQVRRVRFRAVGDVTIIQGEQAGLAIQADREIRERITCEVRGSELDIRLDENWLDWLNPRYWSTGSVRYTITLPVVESIEAGGVGSIRVPDLIAPRLDLSLAGTGNLTVGRLSAERLSARIGGMGNIEVAGRVGIQEVELTGAGNYQAGRLESRQASLRLSGLGSADVWVTDDLDATLSGAGNIDYHGSPRISQRVSGLGSIRSKG